MLTSIPVISPIEVQLADGGPRLLSPPADSSLAAEPHEGPDYEVLPLGSPLSLASPAPDPAARALDEMELAAQISEYHDFSWWDERIRVVRAALEPKASG